MEINTGDLKAAQALVSRLNAELPPCAECSVEDSVLELLSTAIVHLETAAKRAEALGECLRSAREAMIDARGRVGYLRLQKHETIEWNKRGTRNGREEKDAATPTESYS